MTELKRKFLKFHRNNPEVYFELKNLAFDMLESGLTKYSISGLFEVLRFNKHLKTRGSDFKLSNNHRAYYSRLLMKKEPELKGFFNTRDVKVG